MTWGSIGTTTVVAAVGDTEFVREHRLLLWLIGAGAVLAWLGLLALLAAVNEPRRVKPGPETLDLVGGEPPAVVDLVTADWVLGHEAVPATLLDLAGRKYLAIDSQGEDTLVSLTRKVPDRLIDFEGMVYEHVGVLSRQTADGRRPRPGADRRAGRDAERWWKRFRGGVEARRPGDGRGAQPLVACGEGRAGGGGRGGGRGGRRRLPHVRDRPRARRGPRRGRGPARRSRSWRGSSAWPFSAR